MLEKPINIIFIKKFKYYKLLALVILFLLLTTTYAKQTYHFKQYQLKVDRGTISYFKIGGGEEPIVLLHGLFANKEQWLNIINKLSKSSTNFLTKYTIIAPDLAGFGKSVPYPFSAYILRRAQTDKLSQIKILHDFLNKLKIKRKVNIAGNSMGGEIAAFYTMQYPDNVKTLAFFGSPSGVIDFSPTFIQDGFKQGFNPFVPTTLHQFKVELSLLTPNYKNIMPANNVIKEHILPLYRKNYQALTAIFNVINIPENRDGLSKSFSITQPTLIFWGKKDHIFGSIQNGRKLFNNLHRTKYKKMFLIKNAGHLILLGNNKVINELVLHYIKFLKEFG